MSEEEYRNLAEHHQRLQLEVDTARELLRADGIEGFGSLTEGLAKALAKRKQPQFPFAIAVDADQMARIIERMARVTDAMAEPAKRHTVAVELECLKLLVEGCSAQLEIDPHRALREIEAQFQGVLGDLAKHMKEESK